MPTDDAQILRVLRKAISKALCEEQGHIWKDVTHEASDNLTNTMRWERCKTCGKTRPKGGLFSTNATSAGDTITLSGGSD